MGIFSSLCDFASSTVSSACSAISSAASVIGSSIGSSISMLSTVLQTSIPTFYAIIQAVSFVAKVYDLVCSEDPEKDVMDLGMRAEIANSQGVNSEQFTDYQSYIKHLRDEIKTDNIHIENLSEIDKLKYSTLGTAVVMKGIDAQYKVNIPNNFWLTACKMNLAPSEFKPLLDHFEKQNVTPNLADFTERRLNSGENEKIYKVLDGFIQKNYPESSVPNILAKGEFPYSN